MPSPLRAILALIAFQALAILPAAPALADMRVCNQTANPVSIALGYRSNSGWQSEGWWVAQPEGCATVFQGELANRYVYLFAADDISGGAWGGSVYMCTRDDAFTIFGVEDCLARGYERTGFFEVDTEERTDWTVQLTPDSFEMFDPGMDGPGAEPTPDAVPPGPDGEEAAPGPFAPLDGGDGGTAPPVQDPSSAPQAPPPDAQDGPDAEDTP